MSWTVARLTGLSAALLCAGCLADKAQRAYSVRYTCPEERVKVDDLGEGRFRASGCNDTVLFRCNNDVCREQHVPAPAEPWPTAQGGRRTSVQTSEDASLVSLDLQLESRLTLKLRAAPNASGGLVQLKLQRSESSPSLLGCKVDLMVNGARLELPAPTESHDKGKTSLLVALSRDLVRDFAVAEDFAIRVCKTRWELEDHQLRSLRDFAVRYEKELAWAGDGAQGGAGKVAPAGGWVPWQALGPLPAALASGAPLDASQLFEQVSGSVVRVEGVRLDGVSQGSGVAVSPTQVATNCHVLEGARKLLVRQTKKEWLARLDASSPKHDRCLLSIEEPALTPIRGVRRYGQLVVGEKLYTIGAPSGLDLSLSDGLLSGLRQEGGVSYVQTTAPISPGSSGGPLFDARGNLVGITTLALVGRQRINQALNFAIAADAFWSQ